MEACKERRKHHFFEGHGKQIQLGEDVFVLLGSALELRNGNGEVGRNKVLVVRDLPGFVG